MTKDKKNQQILNGKVHDLNFLLVRPWNIFEYSCILRRVKIKNRNIRFIVVFIVQNPEIITKVRILLFASPISALFSCLVQNKIRVTVTTYIYRNSQSIYEHIQFKLTKFRFISIQLNNCLRTIKWRIFVTVLIRTAKLLQNYQLTSGKRPEIHLLSLHSSGQLN